MLHFISGLYYIFVNWNIYLFLFSYFYGSFSNFVHIKLKDVRANSRYTYTSLMIVKYVSFKNRFLWIFKIKKYIAGLYTLFLYILFCGAKLKFILNTFSPIDFTLHHFLSLPSRYFLSSIILNTAKIFVVEIFVYSSCCFC